MQNKMAEELLAGFILKTIEIIVGTSVIIPVKSFQKSKTRLQLSEEKTIELCRLLLREVIKTVSESRLNDKTIVVSEDKISDIIEEYDCKRIPDVNEESVNDATEGLAESYLLENKFTHSIVLPLDVPFLFRRYGEIIKFFRRKISSHSPI